MMSILTDDIIEKIIKEGLDSSINQATDYIDNLVIQISNEDDKKLSIMSKTLIVLGLREMRNAMKNAFDKQFNKK